MFSPDGTLISASAAPHCSFPSNKERKLDDDLAVGLPSNKERKLDDDLAVGLPSKKERKLDYDLATGSTSLFKAVSPLFSNSIYIPPSQPSRLVS